MRIILKIPEDTNKLIIIQEGTYSVPKCGKGNPYCQHSLFRITDA